MRKTLEYYIEKYGEDQGKTRYEGVKKQKRARHRSMQTNHINN